MSTQKLNSIGPTCVRGRIQISRRGITRRAIVPVADARESSGGQSVSFFFFFFSFRESCLRRILRLRAALRLSKNLWRFDCLIVIFCSVTRSRAWSCDSPDGKMRRRGPSNIRKSLSRASFFLYYYILSLALYASRNYCRLTWRYDKILLLNAFSI